MGKKNTGSNSRSKKENGNNGATSSKIHWAYYTEAIFGLQVPIFMIAAKKQRRKLSNLAEKAGQSRR